MIVVKPVIGTPGRTVPKKERSVNSDADVRVVRNTRKGDGNEEGIDSFMSEKLDELIL